MASALTEFYFTKEDPDYSIKGSRDPLAFQVLWQHQGRNLIPYLSTVSRNLHDFQILCLAYNLYSKEPDNAFVRYFIRFEQLMAYVRFDPNNNSSGFNGIDSVRKKLNKSATLQISNEPRDEILSNQRSYGIWGKYNRPFQDIGFTKKESFQDLFNEKIGAIPDYSNAIKIINRVKEKDKTTFNVKDMECLKPLLQFTKKEISFYSESILKVEIPNPYQNKLLEFISNNSLPDNLDLYSFLKIFSDSLSSTNESLKIILLDIESTERILCPLNHIFRYLQTKPIWEKKEILEDSYILQCKQPVNYTFYGGSEEAEIKNLLSKSLLKDNWSLVQDLTKRNAEVTNWRRGVPWITYKEDLLEVYHGEGGFENRDFDPEHNYNNGYFIDTYISLYRQINAR